MYEGRSPQVFVADPDLIRSIFIKDFDHFYDKRILDYGHPLISEMMDVLPCMSYSPLKLYPLHDMTRVKMTYIHMNLFYIFVCITGFCCCGWNFRRQMESGTDLSVSAVNNGQNKSDELSNAGSD